MSLTLLIQQTTTFAYFSVLPASFPAVLGWGEVFAGSGISLCVRVTSEDARDHELVND